MTGKFYQKTAGLKRVKKEPPEGGSELSRSLP